MANTIKQKRGTSNPTASDLVVGELAINTVDGGVFTKTDGGTVVEIGSGGGGGGGGPTIDDYLGTVQTLTSNTSIPANANSAVIGPNYTIDTGVTLTIPTSSSFKIL